MYKVISAFLGLALLSAAGEASQPSQDGLRHCLKAFLTAERAHGVPRGMLAAVAEARAGGAQIEPKAVAVNLDSYYPSRFYHDTVERAAAGARNLHAGGVGTLFLGCLLIRWDAHSQWLSVEQALDPEHASNYFAAYLGRLHRKHGNWTKAVANAWSKGAWRHQAHVCKVAVRFADIRKLKRPTCGK